MKTVKFGRSGIEVPAVAVGCMRISGKTTDEMVRFIHTALESGANFFDHADIYGGGKSEEAFGRALAADSSIRREELFIQSKCAIVPGKYYDQSKDYILQAVDGILKRLGTEYLDCLLLHRPDALVEPEEVAEAFDELEKSGKVRYFGVSNHKPSQIKLLKKYVKQDLQADQLQFAVPVSNMIASGMEVNMDSAGSFDHDGSVLDFCRLEDITIQAWSPFQMPNWKGCFIDAPEYPELNQALAELAEKYGVSKTAIAAAWIFRHPANMQLVTGTANDARLQEICRAADIRLTREEWYKLYLSAGHPLP